MVSNDNKRRGATGAAFLATVLAGGEADRAVAQQPQQEPQAKVTKDTSPDAQLKAIMGDIETSLGHRTAKSERTLAAIKGIGLAGTQKEFLGRIDDMAAAIEALKVPTERKAAQEKLSKAFKAFVRELGNDEFRIREAAHLAIDDVSFYGLQELSEAVEKYREKDAEIAGRARTLLEENRHLYPDTLKKLQGDLKRLAPFGTVGMRAVPLIDEAFWKNPVDKTRRPDYDMQMPYKESVLRAYAAAKAAPELTRHLKDGELIQYRDMTAVILGEMGPDAAWAAPALKELVRTTGSETYARALAAIRADQKNLDALITEAKSGESGERLSAIMGLEMIGKNAGAAGKEARSKVLGALSDRLSTDTDAEARKASAIGLAVIIPLAQSKDERDVIKTKVVPALKAGLLHPFADVQVESANAAGRIGVDAEPLLETLKAKAETTSFREVETACLAATGTIEKAVTESKKTKGR
jgi:hypothetical protein